MYWETSHHSGFAGVSDYQNTIEINRLSGPMVFRSFSRDFVQKIETETIFFRRKLSKQTVAQPRPVRITNETFKDGLLYSLTVIFAGLCHAPQAAPSLFIFRAYIVRDYN